MKRKILTLTAVLIGSTIIATSVYAGQATEQLITCMTDNTTGKDRKDLARWIFASMSIHPVIQNLSNVTENDRDQLDRNLAAIVTRLLTENCKTEAKQALEKEADESPLEAAFGVMGKLAMRELMNDSKVKSGVEHFAKYLDINKFKSLNPDQ